MGSQIRNCILFLEYVVCSTTSSLISFNLQFSVYGKGGKLDKAVEMFAAAQELGLPIDEMMYTTCLAYMEKPVRFLCPVNKSTKDLLIDYFCPLLQFSFYPVLRLWIFHIFR